MYSMGSKEPNILWCAYRIVLRIVWYATVLYWIWYGILFCLIGTVYTMVLYSMVLVLGIIPYHSLSCILS